jgi:hypothetical protein
VPQLRTPPATLAEAVRVVAGAPFEILTRGLNILNLTEQLMAETLIQLREARPLVFGVSKAYAPATSTRSSRGTCSCGSLPT